MSVTTTDPDTNFAARYADELQASVMAWAKAIKDKVDAYAYEQRKLAAVGDMAVSSPADMRRKLENTVAAAASIKLALEALKKVAGVAEEAVKLKTASIMQEGGVPNSRLSEHNVTFVNESDSVDDYDHALIPDKYWERSLNKRKIKYDLRRNKDVPGCRLMKRNGAPTLSYHKLEKGGR